MIFVTVVIGISSLGNLARAGGLALRALGYFLAMTVIALGLGLLAGNVIRPARGLDAQPTAEGAAKAKESIAEAGGSNSVAGFITDDLLPTSFVQPFVDNKILQVLVLAIVTAAAISFLADDLRKRVVGGFELAGRVIFGIIRIIMWAGADRRVRRHGVHRRAVRRRRAGQPRPAGDHVLVHVRGVHRSACSAPSRACPASASSASSG